MSGSGVSAILLAAGESRRMGALNKLALPVAGVPLLRRTALTLLGARLNQVVVVLGHESETARSLLDDLPLDLVVNPAYRDGQMTSVHRGLEALSLPCQGFMVCLADLPLLESADIDALVHAFIHDCPRSILVPTCEGRRGNPVILSVAHRESILSGGRALGCRGLVDNNPDLVWHYRAANDHFCRDLDTPQDYARLLGRIGGHGTLSGPTHGCDDA